MKRLIYSYCLDRFINDYKSVIAGYNSLIFVSEYGNFSVSYDNNICYIYELEQDNNAIFQTVRTFVY